MSDKDEVQTWYDMLIQTGCEHCPFHRDCQADDSGMDCKAFFKSKASADMAGTREYMRGLK